MNRRTLAVFITIFITLGLVVLFAGVVSARENETEERFTAQTNDTPLSVHLNLGPDDPDIDPGLGIGSTDFAVIDQLFLGLVRLDEETGAPLPELATSWDVSEDVSVFTFTLRSDVYWTDGTPLTAEDVRYGILRNLEPDTNAGYAYTLYMIQNAQDYNIGDITDPNQVGVTVLDSMHLRFDLEHSAAYFPSILALPIARPLPESAITANHESWTEPANIVTNGSYKLTVWMHEAAIVLEKNPVYYGAGGVQIEQVQFWMVDETTAWDMYQNGVLDSALVPVDQWSAAQSDAVLGQELHVVPRLCTYYYGFNTAKAPFDDPLVRKAFIAAVYRQGVINEGTGYAQQPALTFTAPGIWGHVDGYTEGVGLPYDPTQAQGWLADAGYPAGVGLPPITLWFNDLPVHQAIAEAVQQDWYATLDVSVTLQSMPWSDYLDFLNSDPPQVWHYGWCADYYDAYNFLWDAIEPPQERFGNWNNPVYVSLLSQAAQTVDLNLRASLYEQAEEILVETDAVMLPIYYYANYYANGFATKPYLERTYGSGGFGGWIAGWRITSVDETIGTDGGSLSSYAGDTLITIPTGAFTDTVILTHSPSYGNPPGGNLNGIDQVFELTAVYSNTGQPAQPTSTYTLQVSYVEEDLGITPEDTLVLYYWNGTQWVAEPSSVADPVNNHVTAAPYHFSKWAVFGEVERIYLPLTMR